MDTNKRVASPGKESFDANGAEKMPEAKKQKLDSGGAGGGAVVSSPATVGSRIKVIPPKDPLDISSMMNNGNSNGKTGSATLASPPSRVTALSPSSSSSILPNSNSNSNNHPINSSSSLLHSKPSNINNATATAAAKEIPVKYIDTQRSKILSQMQLNTDRGKILKLIEEAEHLHQGSSSGIVINDSRLLNENHPNYNVSLGHVVYTGAKSRLPHSNRAIDLDLFLTPKVTANEYFACLEVRIPAEFLSYRGNIAVRKSALWGSDVYTDDSDVVAMIIHSGHYRPVDAPDPSPRNPDAQSLSQAALVSNESTSTSHSASKMIICSEIETKVIPVIAQADPAVSSATILVPNHDLYVQLRVLPRLVKYTGSTRYGLDSKGWGSSHDGESFQVVNVRKVPRGSIAKQGRKTYVKGMDLSAESSKTIVFSEKRPLLKYTPLLMNAWPNYFQKEGHSAPFNKEEMKLLHDLPFWKARLSKYTLLFQEGGSASSIRYLIQGGNALKIEDAHGKVLHQAILNNSIEFNDAGIHFLKQPNTKVSCPISGFAWVEKNKK